MECAAPVQNATVQVGEGLTQATEEYMRTYAVNTARDADLLINQVHAQVNALADVLQSQIGNPGQQAAVGEAVIRVDPSTASVVYDEGGRLGAEPAGVAIRGQRLGIPAGA